MVVRVLMRYHQRCEVRWKYAPSVTSESVAADILVLFRA